MKLNKDVLNVLKNYSTINQGITVKEGNELETISLKQSLYSTFTNKVVEEGQVTFPREFSIYDLNGFLSVVSLFDDPSFEFGADYVSIGQAGEWVIYYYSEPSIIDSPPETINFPEPDFDFFLSGDKLSKILKAANVLSANSIKFASDGNKIVASTFDRSGASDNTFTIDIDQYNGEPFESVIEIDELKVMGGSYTIGVKDNQFLRWASETQNIIYYVILLDMEENV